MESEEDQFEEQEEGHVSVGVQLTIERLERERNIIRLKIIRHMRDACDAQNTVEVWTGFLNMMFEEYGRVFTRATVPRALRQSLDEKAACGVYDALVADVVSPPDLGKDQYYLFASLVCDRMSWRSQHKFLDLILGAVGLNPPFLRKVYYWLASNTEE